MTPTKKYVRVVRLIGVERHDNGRGAPRYKVFNVPVEEKNKKNVPVNAEQ